MTAVNPALRVVSHGEHGIQIGLGTGGLILEGLQGADLAFIKALQRGIADAQLVECAAGLGVEVGRAREICAKLSAVLCPDAELAVHGYREERLRPDRTELLGLYRDSGRDRLARRARNVVQVVGLGRTGAALAGVLASAGVGTILLEDDSPVTASDVSPGTFGKSDIGIPRSLALRPRLTALDPDTKIHMVHDGGAGGPSLACLDLAVLVGRDCAAGGTTARFMRSERAHLLVLHREQDGTVGPLVMPGETACTDCVERHRSDADPQWRQACNELVEGPNAAGGGHPGSPALEASALSLALAGTAAAQALLFLDGVNQPSSWSAVMAFHPDNGRWTRQAFGTHPDCGCQWQEQSCGLGAGPVQSLAPGRARAAEPAQPAATISRTASP